MALERNRSQSSRVCRGGTQEHGRGGPKLYRTTMWFSESCQKMAPRVSTLLSICETVKSPRPELLAESLPLRLRGKQASKRGADKSTSQLKECSRPGTATNWRVSASNRFSLTAPQVAMAAAMDRPPRAYGPCSFACRAFECRANIAGGHYRTDWLAELQNMIFCAYRGYFLHCNIGRRDPSGIQRIPARLFIMSGMRWTTTIRAPFQRAASQTSLASRCVYNVPILGDVFAMVYDPRSTISPLGLRGCIDARVHAYSIALATPRRSPSPSRLAVSSLRSVQAVNF